MRCNDNVTRIRAARRSSPSSGRLPKRSTEDQILESPAEVAARVYQVVSVIADAVLKLGYERFGPDLGKLEEEKQNSKDEPIDTSKQQQ